MKSIITILLTAGLLAGGSVQAQTIIDINPRALDTLGNRTYVFNSANAVDIPAVDIELFNRTNQTFFDSISFGYLIGHGGLIGSYNTDNYNGSGIEFRSRGVQIAPNGSSILSSLIFHFNSPQFVVGSSTVVIWPIAHSTHAISADSARVTITLVAPSGIEHPELKDVKVFMVGSSLWVKKDDENSFGDIRIYNAVGELILTKRVSDNSAIEMDRYAPGLYVVELSMNNGSRAIYKVHNEATH